ncbi:hypothetical protein NECAME_04956, partial [Necator americanus]
MNLDKNGQPGVFQNILNPEKKLFREEFRQYFTVSRKSSIESRTTAATSEAPSAETASFHSAMSKTIPMEKSLLSARPLVEAYASYLDQFEVSRTKLEAPQFGTPGDIANWITSRSFKFFEAEKGLSELHLKVEQADKGTSKVPPMSAELSCEILDEQQIAELPKKSLDRSLAINGCMATTMEIFFTPLAIELLDRFISDFSQCASLIHPSMLVQMCYRECVGRQHRQPLTESLFAT